MSIKTRLAKLEEGVGNNKSTIIVVSPGETEAEALRRYQQETGRTTAGRVVLVRTGVPR